jgi:hypothetical protein
MNMENRLELFLKPQHHLISLYKNSIAYKTNYHFVFEDLKIRKLNAISP